MSAAGRGWGVDADNLRQCRGLDADVEDVQVVAAEEREAAGVLLAQDIPETGQALGRLGVDSVDLDAMHGGAHPQLILGELWPDEERDLDDWPEFRAAERRARALEARLLIALLASQDAIRARAARAVERISLGVSLTAAAANSVAAG